MWGRVDKTPGSCSVAKEAENVHFTIKAILSVDGSSQESRRAQPSPTHGVHGHFCLLKEGTKDHGAVKFMLLQGPVWKGLITLGGTFTCKHTRETKFSHEPGTRRADFGGQVAASAQVQWRDHQTFCDEQWHQKEGERWQKGMSDLRAYSVNVREALEILFRVLRRYCIN